MHIYLFFIFLIASLEASLTLETVYGRFTVEEPVIIELIESAPFQRLKGVNQYGFTPFLKPTETYKRYEHSIGVYLLLREHSRPLIEQVAGLLHDVSHTAFSHVGDYVFTKSSLFSAYQDEIHEWYLLESGLADILNKYSISTSDVLPEKFPLLKNKLPELCADRIDYNLQGGFLRGLISEKKLHDIWNELHIESDKWLLSSAENAEILGDASIIMTETLWGSPRESIVNRLGAQAIKHAIAKGIISEWDFHFSYDDFIWNKLDQSQDPYIKELMFSMKNADACFLIGEKGSEDFLIFEKCRAINPLIKQGSKICQLTEISSSYFDKFHLTQKKMREGWPIIWLKSNRIIEIH